jgi:hypothetical protein
MVKNGVDIRIQGIILRKNQQKNIKKGQIYEELTF